MNSGIVSLSNATVLSTYEGSSPFELFLIACQPGHPPDAERVLVKVLEELHNQHPFELLFTTRDSQHVYLELEEKELPLTSYRKLNPEINAEVMSFFVNTGLASAEFAFGVVSQPAVPVWLLDDWFGWALSRDSILKLDAQSAALNITLSFVSSSQEPGRPDPVGKFARLLRLELSHSEYEKLVAAGDPVHALVQDQAHFASLPQAAAFLGDALATALDFYKGMHLRVQALVAGAVARMKKVNARRGAIVVPAHFADLGESLLRERHVSFVKVMPQGVTVNSLLDASAEFLHVKHRNRKLEDLFSGQPFRTDVDMLLDGDDKELGQKRAQDWAVAAHGYVFRYEQKREPQTREMAEKCLERALGLVPDLSFALWLKGELYRLDANASAGLRLFEQIVRKEPREGRYWRAKAGALRQLGRNREAYKCYLRAIHLDPKKKEFWSSLGEYLYYAGRKRAACFCFFKGKELGSEEGRHNFDTVCRRDPTLWDRPLSLQPPVIRLMNRFVLPLRYGGDDVRLMTSLTGGLIASLIVASYGAYVGFRAGGFLSGLIGSFAFLLASLLVAAAVFINVAELSGKGWVWNRLISRTISGIAGATAGYFAAIMLSTPRWLPLASVALMLIGTAVGASLGFLPRFAVRYFQKLITRQTGKIAESGAGREA